MHSLTRCTTTTHTQTLPTKRKRLRNAIRRSVSRWTRRGMNTTRVCSRHLYWSTYRLRRSSSRTLRRFVAAVARRVRPVLLRRRWRRVARALRRWGAAVRRVVARLAVRTLRYSPPSLLFLHVAVFAPLTPPFPYHYRRRWRAALRGALRLQHGVLGGKRGVSMPASQRRAKLIADFESNLIVFPSSQRTLVPPSLRSRRPRYTPFCVLSTVFLPP